MDELQGRPAHQLSRRPAEHPAHGLVCLDQGARRVLTRPGDSRGDRGQARELGAVVGRPRSGDHGRQEHPVLGPCVAEAQSGQLARRQGEVHHGASGTRRLGTLVSLDRGNTVLWGHQLDDRPDTDQPRRRHPDAVRHGRDQAVGAHGDDEPFGVALEFRERATFDLVRSLRGTHHLPIGGKFAEVSPRRPRLLGAGLASNLSREVAAAATPTAEGTARRPDMSRVATYLNFMGTTEEAFRFYRSVFGTEITGEIARMGDMPRGPGAPELSDAEKKLVAHVELPILAGHVLTGSDVLESMGHQLKVGNNVTICLEPDNRAEADRLYAALSDGGTESTGMAQMPWAYWGCSLDRFGARWMFNCYEPAP